MNKWSAWHSRTAAWAENVWVEVKFRISLSRRHYQSRWEEGRLRKWSRKFVFLLACLFYLVRFDICLRKLNLVFYFPLASQSRNDFFLFEDENSSAMSWQKARFTENHLRDVNWLLLIKRYQFKILRIWEILPRFGRTFIFRKRGYFFFIKIAFIFF